jgi:hypothetical protein
MKKFKMRQTRFASSAPQILCIIFLMIAATLSSSSAEDRFGTSKEELDRLKSINASDMIVTLSDVELSKLMVGNWSTGRHDYVYRPDGTWQMLPIQEGGTNGSWKIEGKKLIQGSTKREIIEASDKQFTLRNVDGKYPDRYVKTNALDKDAASVPTSAPAVLPAPDQVILDFLKWYLPVAFKNGSAVILDKRMDAYIDSKTLAEWRKAEQSEDGYGAVPFVGQDYDNEWAKTFKVTKIEADESKAKITVSYTAPKWSIRLLISLSKTKTGWMITDYQPLEN